MKDCAQGFARDFAKGFSNDFAQKSGPISAQEFAQKSVKDSADDSAKDYVKDSVKDLRDRKTGRCGRESRTALFERHAMRELCGLCGLGEPSGTDTPRNTECQETTKITEIAGAPSARVLLAVSGGVDSMVMSNVAAKLFAANPHEVAIAHVNFHLRGEASDLDEKFVREWGAAHGIKVFTADFDTRSIAEEAGISIEMAARNLRYEWFYDIAIKEKYDFIAIAHNANDNAETLILNLVRGTGYAGLKGIAPLREENVRGHGFRIIRPLLWAQRSEIEDYANSIGLAWRTDATNGESEFARNKIRNKVLPLLSEINPSVVGTLNRNIGRLAAANEILSGYVAEKESALDLCRKNGDSADAVLPGMDILSLRKRYLLSAYSIAALCREGGFPRIMFLIDSILSKYGFNSSVTADIAASAVSPRPESRVFCSPSHTAVIERGFLKLYAGIPKPDPEEITVGGPGEYMFGGMTIVLTVLDEGGKTADNGATSLLDADKVRFPLICRTMRSGDRFRPFGMKGKKSVADFLNGRKTDVIFRTVVPVLQETETEGRIVALPGVEICDDLRITGSTRRILAVTVRQ